MPRIDNPNAYSVDVVAPQPLRLDLVCGRGTIASQGWLTSTPVGTGVTEVADWDLANSYQLSDSSATDRPSIAKALPDSFLTPLWTYGGKLYARIGCLSTAVGESCTIGFGIASSASRGWSVGVTASAFIGVGITVKRVSGGFDFYWFNSTTKLGNVTSGTGSSCDIEIKFTPLSSRYDLYANGTLIATAYNWLNIDEFFTGVCGIYTRPASVTTVPVTLRRLCLTAYIDDASITIPAGQFYTRVFFPDEVRNYVVKVPDGPFLTNSVIEAVTRSGNQVTFQRAGSRALFSHRYSMAVTRATGALLRANATMVGPDGSDFWTVGG
jgi:hypothetical protein